MWATLKRTVWASLGYALPAISLTEKQSKSLCTTLYGPLLAKLGCNRNYPLSLRHNLVWMLGLNLPEPYIE